MTGVGVVAGGAVLFGTDGLAAPLVLAGVGAAGAARAGGNLWDRAQHGGSIDPLHDSTARGIWLDFGANTSGVLASGAAAQIARLGSEASAGLQLGSSVEGIGAGVMNTAATAATALQLVTGWNQMSPEQRLEAGIGIAFWGAGAMAGLRTGTRPYDLPAQREQIAFEAAPITRDSTLPAGQVQVEYAADPTGGPPSVHIRASETAAPHDIELHVAAAQRLQAYKRTGEWPVGSRAYEAHHEIAKVDQYIAAAQAERPGPASRRGAGRNWTRRSTATEPTEPDMR